MEAIEFINIICPEHDRTSCSDSNISNGFFTRNESWHGRCKRCMYLEILECKTPTGFVPDECHG